MIEALARTHQLDADLARDLLDRAEAWAALDPTQRSMWDRFEALVDTARWGAHRVTPGKQSAIDARYGTIDRGRPPHARSTPGKRTLTMAMATKLDAPQGMRPEPLPARQATTAMSRAHASRSAAGREYGRAARAPETRAIHRHAASQAALDARVREALALAARSSSGQALPAALRRELETALGADLSEVRVHVSADAADAADAVRAHAYTLGEDIYFASGRYDPASDEGRRLIAHEVAHTVQHRQGAGEAADQSPAPTDEFGGLLRPFRVSQPDDALEVAAERFADSFHGARTATRALSGSASGPAPVTAAALPALATTRATSAAGPGAVVHRTPDGGGEAPASPAAAPATVVDLFGSGQFEPPADIAEHLEQAGEQGAQVRVKFGALTQTGVIKVKKSGAGYVTDESRPQHVPLAHPLFTAVPGLDVVLRIQIGAGGAVTGYATLGSLPGDAKALVGFLAKDASGLGLPGFTFRTLPLTNALAGGTLTIGTSEPVPFELAGWVTGDLMLQLVNETVTLEATAQVKARGLEDGELRITRGEDGVLSGQANLAVKLSDKFSGTATATYEDGDVTVDGSLTYQSEKFTGTMGIIVAEADKAEQMVKAKIDPEGALTVTAQDAGGGQRGGAPTKGERGIAGWGELDFSFTEWLTGRATVAYGPSGHITVLGKIAPPARLDLMKDPKGFSKEIVPQVKVQACYGVPYVADVHLGVSVGLLAEAKMGPIYMTDLVIDGVYSTDPTVLNKFSISGALRAQAYAALILRAEGYAGLNIAAHAIDFGAGINGIAAIKAYAEARPTLGYREMADPASGKMGQYYLQGHLEMAAQPVLGLSGDLFVRLDSPWWSPAPDKKWPWELGSLEYPLPGQFGLAADVDYVIGSDQWPELKLSEASFDSSKFIDNLMDDKVPASSAGAEREMQASWQGQPTGAPTEAPPAVNQTPSVEAIPATGGASNERSGGQQTDEEKKNVPQTQESSQRSLAGWEALGKLQKRAESDPRTKAEIDSDLAKIKSSHGFTRLTARLSGDEWLVDAAINPEKDYRIKAQQEKDEDKKGEGEKDKQGQKDAQGEQDKKGEKDAQGDKDENASENAYKATARDGTTKKSYDVTGPFSVLFAKHEYPAITGLTAHPINKSHLERPTKPTGNYHLTKIQTPSAKKWRDAWQKELRSELALEMDPTYSSLPESEKLDRAQNALVARYRATYPVVTSWNILNLTKKTEPHFEGHHVAPTNWGGRDEATNICFLTKVEHSKFTSFFASAKAALFDAVYEP